MGTTERLLLPHHREDLEASGLTDATIQANRIHSLTKEETQSLTGIRLACTGSLAFPYGVYETVSCATHPYRQEFIRVKPDYTESATFRPKYVSPKGSRNHLYVPKTSLESFSDAQVALYVVEGEKKALAVAQAGLCSVGIAGVWAWKTGGGGGYRNGGGSILPEFTREILLNREVYVIFDSDCHLNWKIKVAQNEFIKSLALLGANAIPIVTT